MIEQGNAQRMFLASDLCKSLIVRQHPSRSHRGRGGVGAGLKHPGVVAAHFLRKETPWSSV
jgi:hypothetical protein